MHMYLVPSMDFRFQVLTLKIMTIYIQLFLYCTRCVALACCSPSPSVHSTALTYCTIGDHVHYVSCLTQPVGILTTTSECRAGNRHMAWEKSELCCILGSPLSDTAYFSCWYSLSIAASLRPSQIQPLPCLAHLIFDTCITGPHRIFLIDLACILFLP